VEEAKIKCTATVDDDFAEGRVLVVMKQKDSKVNKERKADEFSTAKGVSVKKVTDLSSMKSSAQDEKNAKKCLNTKDFHQVLQIDIAEKGKDAVLRTIKELEKRDDVLCATPDYVMTLYSTQTNTEDEVVSSEISVSTSTFASNYANDPYRPYQYALDNIQWDNAWVVVQGAGG
jgi:hypothetical protein